MMIKKRALVSFDGECPYYCKHCYTYSLEQKQTQRSIEEIVDSISNQNFDIIYVSQRRENFVIPEEGIALCEALFERYHTDIVAITRNIFSTGQVERLSGLNQRMIREKKQLFLAVSIPALESAAITEELSRIPSPEERIESLHRLFDAGINTFLVVRPLYPEHIIPVKEIMNLIDKCKGFISCVLSSGLMANKSILGCLGYDETDFTYLDEGESDYLVGAIEDVKYINVEKELKVIREYCDKVKVPFFKHSIPAVNYIKNLNDYSKVIV